MHNHPSGDPTPSDADRRLTRKIQEVGQIVEISLLDHVDCRRIGGGRRCLLQLQGGGAFMNDPHDSILEKYLWAFVGRGDAPADTPLFTGIQDGEPLSTVIARGVRPFTARGGFRHRVARKEVAL
jgi:RadC-like JAB domain